jgi:hypothetical protein
MFQVYGIVTLIGMEIVNGPELRIPAYSPVRPERARPVRAGSGLAFSACGPGFKVVHELAGAS